MSGKIFSNAVITGILNAEKQRIEAAPQTENDAYKKLDADQVMRILHARNMAQEEGRKDLLDGMTEDIRWAEIQLAESNPYLTTTDPTAFCQQLLESGNLTPAPEKISVDDVLNELSGES